MVNVLKEVQEIKKNALDNEIPIITDQGLTFLMNYIKDNNIKKILEIGTAIGYSAIMMALVNKDIEVTTIERDEKRYLEAIKNIKKVNLENRITLIYNDALNVSLDEKFDLIFIDAAKAQYMKFFNLYTPLLKIGGVVFCDNMLFHGLVLDEANYDNLSRSVRGLARKLKAFHDELLSNKSYKTSIFDIGDGISISVKL